MKPKDLCVSDQVVLHCRKDNHNGTILSNNRPNSFVVIRTKKGTFTLNYEDILFVNGDDNARRRFY